MRAEESFRRGDSETWRTLAEESLEEVEHLEEYFGAGFSAAYAVESVFNDTHGIFHELPAMAVDGGIRKKMIERNTATIRRIREDYQALFKD